MAMLSYWSCFILVQCAGAQIRGPFRGGGGIYADLRRPCHFEETLPLRLIDRLHIVITGVNDVIIGVNDVIIGVNDVIIGINHVMICVNEAYCFDC